MHLIGLTGSAGCGKDTIANFLMETHGFVQIALADPLRDGLKAMLGITNEQLYRRDLKEATIDWIGRSPRELMQTLGTEWGREYVAADIWLRDLGGQLWHIKGKQRHQLDGQTATHSSEQHIPAMAGEPRIYNFGTLENLYDEVTDTLKEFSGIRIQWLIDRFHAALHKG